MQPDIASLLVTQAVMMGVLKIERVGHQICLKNHVHGVSTTLVRAHCPDPVSAQLLIDGMAKPVEATETPEPPKPKRPALELVR